MAISTINITESTTLNQLLSLLPATRPAKRPTAKWLEENKLSGNVKEIATYTHSGEKDGEPGKPHLAMKVRLFDNGYGIYSSGGHRTIVWIRDCLDVTYRFGFSTSEEKEADQTKIEEEVLGNMPWFQAVVLRGEMQISAVLDRDLHGSRESAESENPEKGSENPANGEEEPEEELRGSVAIPGPEEKYIRQETYWEIQGILDLLPEEAAETWRLYHEYGMGQQEIADMLGISQQAVSKRIEKAQEALREILKRIQDLLCISVKAEI